MFSQEETKTLERKIRQTSRTTIRDSRKLKAILKIALAEFEKALDALPQNEREVASSLYLERIREVSFTFHLAVLRLRAGSDALNNPTREALRARLEQYGKELQEVAELYQLL